MRFLYGVTLEQADLPERIAHAREPRKLPIVLGSDEVVRFLEAVPSLKARAALATAYAAGLRASEAAGIKVADTDSSRMGIRVEQGRGGCDRYVMLSSLGIGHCAQPLLCNGGPAVGAGSETTHAWFTRPVSELRSSRSFTQRCELGYSTLI